MTNNKQSSSIEWIIKQLIFKTEFENLPIQYVLMSDKDIDSIIEQAKAMHKEEMINFTTDWHHNGLLSLGVLVSTSVEEHYNKTFK